MRIQGHLEENAGLFVLNDSRTRFELGQEVELVATGHNITHTGIIALDACGNKVFKLTARREVFRGKEITDHAMNFSYILIEAGEGQIRGLPAYDGRGLENELKAEVARKNMTLDELADKIGMEKSALRHRFRYPDVFSVIEIKNIAAALQLDNSRVLDVFFSN